MRTTACRSHERPRLLLIVTMGFVLCVALAAGHAHAAARHPAKHKASHLTKVVKAPRLDEPMALPPLPYSDEFDRAELIERMLNECRGISYNAYELAQTSGEQLRLPAPIQLMVVRVRHPWCAELLRAYAPKARV
jgi:hypothetical protein